MIKVIFVDGSIQTIKPASKEFYEVNPKDKDKLTPSQKVEALALDLSYVREKELARFEIWFPNRDEPVVKTFKPLREDYEVHTFNTPAFLAEKKRLRNEFKNVPFRYTFSHLKESNKIVLS